MRTKESWNLGLEQVCHFTTWVYSCWRSPLKMSFNPFKTFILKLLLAWHFCNTSLQNIFLTAAGSSWHLGDLNDAFVQQWPANSKCSGCFCISYSPAVEKRRGGNSSRRRHKIGGQEAGDRLEKMGGGQEALFLRRENWIPDLVGAG